MSYPARAEGLVNMVIGALNSHQRSNKGNGGLGNKRTSGDHPNYSIVMIGLNTEKSPGDLLSLRTPVRNHQQTLVRKTQMSKIIIIKIITVV